MRWGIPGLNALLAASLSSAVAAEPPAQNPSIDMQGHLAVSSAAAAWRRSHRISETEFLRLSLESGTLILDARSPEKFAELHVRDAVNLTFSDIAVDSLARLIPDKSTRILIYCNNNFRNAEGPFPTKLPTASLNLSTFIALYDYGYRNVYELAPQIDLKQTVLDLEPAKLAKSADS